MTNVKFAPETIQKGSTNKRTGPVRLFESEVSAILGGLTRLVDLGNSILRLPIGFLSLWHGTFIEK